MTSVQIINNNDVKVQLENNASQVEVNILKEEMHISNIEEDIIDEEYWQDVSDYKQLFEKFSAQELPKELTTAQAVRLLLEQNEYLEDPFYIIDLSRVVRQFLQWKKLLPRVQPFYAIKCNPAPFLMQVIESLGGSFDCASKKEIDLAINNANVLIPNRQEFIPSERIIFANPCKQISNIKYAASAGVEMTTADNECELKKIAQYWPNAKVVIRIKTDDSHSICQFSTKFGASVERGDVKRLLQVGQELGLTLHGVSFHVGSGCMSTQSFVDAITNARRVFDMAKEYGHDMKFLDIGGGFPGINVKGFPTFKEIADAVRPVLDELFDESVQIIGEPGRYFACASHTLVTNIFAKRVCNKQVADNSQPDRMYYINDGVYGSFNCLFFDHADVTIRHLPREESSIEETQTGDLKLSTIYGPTCDSIDCIKKVTPLPEMEIGDYMYFPNFGAYTVAAGSDFNGFKTNTIYYVWSN